MQSSRGWWWLSGLVAGGLGLAASYLVAGLLRVRSAPVVAVAEAIIAIAPGSLVRWGIATFGDRDKQVLVAVILVVLGALCGWLGVLARRRWWVAVAGVGLLTGMI